MGLKHLFILTSSQTKFQITNTQTSVDGNSHLGHLEVTYPLCIRVFADKLANLKIAEYLRNVKKTKYEIPLPIGSMYSIFAYIQLIFMVDVGEYT